MKQSWNFVLDFLVYSKCPIKWNSGRSGIAHSAFGCIKIRQTHLTVTSDDFNVLC